MKKPVIALAATAVALGAAAIFLRLQLDIERERAADRATRARESSLASPPPAPRVASAAHSPTGLAAAAATTDSRAEHDTRPTAEDQSAARRRAAAEYLRRLEDPAGRQENHKRALDTARRMTAGLEGRPGLTPDRYERLVQLLADQEMGKRIASARCVLDPACDVPAIDQAASAARGRAVHALIGDEGMRELRASRVFQMERELVAGLQGRLANDTPLTPTQADDLTRTLFEERRRQDRQVQERQQDTTFFSTREGAYLQYAQHSPTPELAMQSAEESIQAIRDRAATLLAGEQLAAFNRMYDDLFITIRRNIRNDYAGARR